MSTQVNKWGAAWIWSCPFVGHPSKRVFVLIVLCGTTKHLGVEKMAGKLRSLEYKLISGCRLEGGQDSGWFSMVSETKLSVEETFKVDLYWPSRPRWTVSFSNSSPIPPGSIACKISVWISCCILYMIEWWVVSPLALLYHRVVDQNV